MLHPSEELGRIHNANRMLLQEHLLVARDSLSRAILHSTIWSRKILAVRAQKTTCVTVQVLSLMLAYSPAAQIYGGVPT